MSSPTSLSLTGGSLGHPKCLSDVLRETMKTISKNVEFMYDYDTPNGMEELRSKIANLIGFSNANLHWLTKNHIRTMSSAQQALNIVMEMFIELIFSKQTADSPVRACILVQEPAFFGLIRIVKKLRIDFHVEVLSFVQVTNAVELIKDSFETERFSHFVVYMTSNFNPYGCMVNESEKDSIADCAEKYQGKVFVVEDNPYDFLVLESESPKLSLPTTICERIPDYTIHVGSFSKILAPGLRVAYIFGGDALIFSRILHSKKLTCDIFTSTLCQKVCCLALDDGEEPEFLCSLRKYLRSRRDVAMNIVSKHSGRFHSIGLLSWNIPDGGIFFKLSFDHVLWKSKSENMTRFEMLLKICKERYSLILEPSKFNYIDGHERVETRVNFAMNTSEDFEECMVRLQQAISSLCPELVLDIIILSAIPYPNPTTLDKCGVIGCEIGNEFLKIGHRVHYISAAECKKPTKSDLLVCYNCDSMENMYESITTANTFIDGPAVILDCVAGHENAQNPLAAVTANVREINANFFRVGLYVSDQQREVLDIVDLAYKRALSSRWNLTMVMNGCDVGTDSIQFPLIPSVLYITPEKGIYTVNAGGVNVMVRTMDELLLNRCIVNHYRTVLCESPFALNDMKKEIEQLRQTVSKAYALSLFIPYLEDKDDRHFGFVAVRTPQQGGFLITCRGSDKKTLPDSHIVHVLGIDSVNRTVRVSTKSNGKASLNANVAGRIFNLRSDVHTIIHAHVFPPVVQSQTTKIDRPPSTVQDEEEIMKILIDPQNHMVLLPNHGVITVGQTANECFHALGKSHAYNHSACVYDTIYHRFLISTSFVDLVCRECSSRDKILDLCGGTGEVSFQLFNRGFLDVSMADSSGAMMKVAEEKFRKSGAKIPMYLTCMETVAIDDTVFDSIVMRQSVNYLMSMDRMKQAFRKMYTKLRNGGKLIFNCPNFDTSKIPSYLLPRTNTFVLDSDTQKLTVRSYEGNWVETSHANYTIHHIQHSVIARTNVATNTEILRKQTVAGELVPRPTIERVFDLNIFGLFTRAQYEEALIFAGFKGVKVYGDRFQCGDMTKSKSLYFVAVKLP